ncbi:MAG: hypothetical protein WBB82_00105 [Limnothrix sp.]
MLKFIGLAGGLLLTWAIAPDAAQAAQTPNPDATIIAQSTLTTEISTATKETETCIELRGCGRRDLT